MSLPKSGDCNTKILIAKQKDPLPAADGGITEEESAIVRG